MDSNPKKIIMSTNFKTELPILLIVLAPFLYLAQIWNTLPEKVALHWNAAGEIDRWGDKIELLLIPFALPLLTYLILIIAPKIDPKNKLKYMGKKFNNLKFILIVFMSGLAIYILYSTQNEMLLSPGITHIISGLLILILGNYFKTIKHNYFIGIRTPWTLESEIVWRETHILGGKLWFIGGLVIITSTLLTSAPLNEVILISTLTIIIAVPVVFSYIRFKKLKDQ